MRQTPGQRKQEIEEAKRLSEVYNAYPEDAFDGLDEQGKSENFKIENGKVVHNPQPPERKKIDGIDI